MNIGVITTHIAPAKGYGGPAVSVSILIALWGQRIERVLVCSSDASEGGALQRNSLHVPQNTEVALYHAYWFRRWGFGLGAIVPVLRTCRSANGVYVNGIATWPTTIGGWVCVFLGKSFVVALRGGLMSEHVEVVRSKKWLKWRFYKWLVLPLLRRSDAIHCTGRIEAEAAGRLLGSYNRIFVAPNGIDLGKVGYHPMPEEPSLILCYAGRISREKGINGFIKAWLDVRRSQDRLIVAGSGGGQYFEDFKTLVKEAEGAIGYKGYLDSDEVAETIAASHFVVLPSGLEGDIRENFGNSVAEALAGGRPVLLSAGLEWDFVEERDIGIVFARSRTAVKQAIKKAQETGCDRRRAMSESARRYAEVHLDAEKAASKVLDRMQMAVKCQAV